MVREDIKKFLTYLKAEKGLADNTSFAYENDLSQLATFVEEEAAKQGVIPSWSGFSRQAMMQYCSIYKERSTPLRPGRASLRPPGHSSNF